MLGLSWTEMLVVGVVALIVIGPKELPVVMGRIGKFVGQIQRMGREFQREINKTTGLDEVRNLRNTITSPLKQTADEIRREFNAIGKDGQQKPTGVLQPKDPQTESVVEAIQEKAGMTPAPVAKTNDEMAADYGFKPSQAAKPVKGVRSTPPSFADTKAGKAKAEAEQPKAAEAKPTKAAPKKSARPKAAIAAEDSAAPAKVSKPRAPRKPAAAKAEPVAPVETAPAKPVRKPRTKTVAAADAPLSVDEKPAAKPRAARKKTAPEAGKN